MSPSRPQSSELKIRTTQAARLRRYLDTVVLPFNARYRAAFDECGLEPGDLRTLDDLQFLPFTTKSELASDPRAFVIIPEKKILARRPGNILRALLRGRRQVARQLEREYRPIFLTSTTGRSTDPVPFVYTEYDLDRLAETGRRLFETSGATTGMKLLNMFPFAPHLAFWQAFYGGATFGAFTLSSGGGKVMGTAGQIRFIRKLQPEVLIGMPTFVYHVLHEAAGQGVRNENLKRVVLGGEKVPGGMRRKLRDLAHELGAPDIDVVSTYGFTEARMAWAECPHPVGSEPTGFHLHPDLGIIEIVDPDTGMPLPPCSPGEIVFTPIDARGTVVLRYRTGDLIDGGLTYEPCPRCGHAGPRLLGKISRLSDVRALRLDKLKGTLVDFNQLEHILDDMPGIGAWQIELRKQNDDPLELDEIVLHIAKLGGDDDEQLVHEIDHRFAQIEVHPNRVNFHDAGELRRLQGVGAELKEQRLVDHRPKTTVSPPVSEEREAQG